VDARLYRVDGDSVGGDFESERLEKCSRTGAGGVREDDVRNRLTDWAGAPEPDPTLKQDPFYRWLYWQNISAVEDRLRLAVGRSDDNARKFLRQLKWLRRWQKPKFPLQGRDLLKLGMEPGPAIKQALARLEQIWVDSGFSAGRDKLLSHI
jgi:poly(A) polymerase